MKNLFLVLLLCFSFTAPAAITIVSDLDDTIKITNSGDLGDASYNGIFTMNVFTGMPKFLQEARYYSDELHVLSAAPAVLAPKVRALLKKYEISYESIILRNVLSGQGKLDYKIRTLRKLIDQSSDDFILIGDDVGEDPEAYDTIMKLYPGRVLAHYIHVVKGRSFPPSAVSYWTSFELALQEYLAGRMLDGAVNDVAQLLLQEKKITKIFPSFADCPTNLERWQWQYVTEFAHYARVLNAKFIAHCKARRSSK